MPSMEFMNRSEFIEPIFICHACGQEVYQQFDLEEVDQIPV